MSENEILNLDKPSNYKKRKTVVDGYINIIYKMLRDKIAPEEILAYVIKSGYSGNLRTLQSYIEILAKNNFKRTFHINWAYQFEYPTDIVVLKRNEILKYITTRNPKVKIDENMGKYLDIIKQKYKIVSELEQAYDEFYKILMKKCSTSLEEFIKKYELSAIKGFVEGIKKDITPVKNAISRDENSGFVEGNNNKFKLIKRILYGRSGLVNLFKKSYFIFQSKHNVSKLLKLKQADVVY